MELLPFRPELILQLHDGFANTFKAQTGWIRSEAIFPMVVSTLFTYKYIQATGSGAGLFSLAQGLAVSNGRSEWVETGSSRPRVAHAKQQRSQVELAALVEVGGDVPARMVWDPPLISPESRTA